MAARASEGKAGYLLSVVEGKHELRSDTPTMLDGSSRLLGEKMVCM